ncbi:MAG: anti-sigma F factor [Clostridia bacterium]|nr:anti-sigma F factor [Clostridia bacterium]
MENKMKLTFPSHSSNQAFARNVISCFALSLNPSVAEISDIKTAVSEAVTNAVVHGYPNSVGEIVLEALISGNSLHITVSDNGIGIDNVEEALEPFYTTKPEDERSGMGFSIIKSFMDEMRVESIKGQGTKVYMSKNLKTDS